MSLFSKSNRHYKSEDFQESISVPSFPNRYVILIGVDIHDRRNCLIVPYHDSYNEFDYMRLYSSYSFTVMDIIPVVSFNTML